MAEDKKSTHKSDRASELFKNFIEFVGEFKNESDRAAVVLGAAKLDYLLYQVLTKHLLPNAGNKDDLFEGDSPLSTFSAKINLAYRLGIIDGGFTRALHLVRRIRNSFAHEVSGCSLDSGSHRDRVKELVAPFEDLPAYTGFKNLFFGDKEGSRSDFYTILGAMVVRLENLHNNLTPIKGDNASSTFVESK